MVRRNLTGMAIITFSSVLVSEKLNITNWHGYYYIFKVFWLVRNSISLTGMAIITFSSVLVSEKTSLTGMAIITFSSVLVSEKLNFTNWHGY